MSVSASIPDTSLGLTSSEIQILRQQQQIAIQNGHAGNGVSRGRGTGRTSNSSSRAASAASSHNRLLLDPLSLRALGVQLDGLQEQIRRRIDYVCFLSFYLSSVSVCPAFRCVCRPSNRCSWRNKCNSRSKTPTIAQETSFEMLMSRSPAPVLSWPPLMSWRTSWPR